jgi:hypothetical protein
MLSSWHHPKTLVTLNYNAATLLALPPSPRLLFPWKAELETCILIYVNSFVHLSADEEDGSTDITRHLATVGLVGIVSIIVGRIAFKP